MYSFLRRPAWLGLHIVVLAIVIAFVSLGMWQLRRLDERRTSNEVAAERLERDPKAWAGGVGDVPPEYTRLTVEGEFRSEEEVLLRSQVNLGRPGFDVLTPLYVDETAAILVNRGWVPLEFDSTPVAGVPPPTGKVAVSGFARYPLDGDTPIESLQGSIVARIDLDSLNRGVAGELASFYLEMTSGPVTEGATPIIDAAPDLTDGPHLSYAVQWFAFTAVSLVGYAALIRSTARRRAGLNRRRGLQPPLPS